MEPSPDRDEEIPHADDEPLTREAVRVYRRYATEIVERYRFCPYAEKSRVEGRTREIVSLDRAPDLQRSLALVRRATLDASIEIGLLIYPNATLGRLELSRFVEQLRRAHQAEPGGLVMAMEAFHPDAGPDLENPDRHVPYVRRTPDPTIQLVRHDVLLRVRRAGDHGTAFFDPSRMSLDALLASPAPVPLHAQIAKNNLATTLEHGVPTIDAVYADIQRDRDESYERARRAR